MRKAVLRMTGPKTGVVEYVDVDVSTPPLDVRDLPTSSVEELNSAPDGAQASEIRPDIPDGWLKGQLLNVRNNGAEWVVTVLGEEFDPRYPDRALKFPHSVACQAFISKWYARESADPRAF